MPIYIYIVYKHTYKYVFVHIYASKYAACLREFSSFHVCVGKWICLCAGVYMYARHCMNACLRAGV